MRRFRLELFSKHNGPELIGSFLQNPTIAVRLSSSARHHLAARPFATMAAKEPESFRLPKKLIVLCDGTWQNSDRGSAQASLFSAPTPQVPSNVTRIARAVKHEGKNKHPQIVYYHAGVGTSWSLADKIFGGALAFGISEHIREAYGFVAHNYAQSTTGAEDEIYLLGFSRGAFTARSTGGMISTFGLLTKTAMEHFFYIFEDFESAGKPGYQIQITKRYPDFKVEHDAGQLDEYLEDYKNELFRLNLTRKVNIKAIAVWDTVGTLGLPVQPWLQKLGAARTIQKYRFFDTGISNCVEHAFHALALDERRAAFDAAVWERPIGISKTVLKQVWFAGAHSNIGGSYDDSCSADLALAWMVDQLSAFIDFDEEYVINQFQSNLQKYYYRENQPKQHGKRLWTWGTQTINEGLTFPESLAGSTTRSPGRYFELNYITGKPDAANPKLLRDTNESIHSSVRARFELHGKDATLHHQYNSPALKNWTLIKSEETTTGAGGDKDVESNGGLPVWRYNNPENANDLANGRVLPEAPLGRLETLLLARNDAQTRDYLFEGEDGVVENLPSESSRL